MGAPNRVLVVEDDDATRTLLVAVLRKGGYEVREAADGEAALGVLASAPADLVLTDVYMPRMNGVEFLQRLSSLPASPQALVMTAHGTASTQAKVEAFGAAGFIRKPVSPKTLLEEVRRALARPGGDVAGAEVPGPAPDRAETGKAGAPAPVETRGEVLVADDDDGCRMLLHRILAREGFIVHEAENGRIAYEKALASDFDMIFMDINMPEMNGVEAIHLIMEANPHAFIVVVTGEGTRDDIHQALKSGSYAYMEKPIQVPVFIEKVRNYDVAAQRQRRETERARQRAEAEARRTIADRAGDAVRSAEDQVRRAVFRGRKVAVTLLVAAIGVVTVLLLPYLLPTPTDGRSGSYSDRWSAMFSRIERLLLQDQQLDRRKGSGR